MDSDDDLFRLLFAPIDTDPFEPMPSPPSDFEFPPNGVLDMNHNGNLNNHLGRLNGLSGLKNSYNENEFYEICPDNSNMKFSTLFHLESEVDMNDIPSFHQQPLALGFYVSTIGTLNPLPLWMLQGKLNQRLNNSSSVFKATLHVSVPNAQHSDDMLFAQSHDQKSIHPLDSNYTYVVLRSMFSLKRYISSI